MKIPLYIVIFFLSYLLVANQNESKVVTAYESGSPIVIDGILNEAVWQKPGAEGFIQRNPNDGEKPTERTIVWVAFDKESLYVAARMYDSEPDKIVSRLGRRDDNLNSDWFQVAIDPYFDKRTGFEFRVTPAGSIMDMTLYNDSWNDSSWDGIWESGTHIDSEGWTVEIRIPFHQLRFKKQQKYIWGINFKRTIKRKNEEVLYSWTPKEESGYVSHFAKLKGIENIDPGLYIEALPYAVGKARFSPEEKGNPFETGSQYSGNGGMDLKIGLKSNLTLDLTVNPDFGQVEVDPAVVNLSAFETYYSEKRPFFVEGSSIFNFGRGGSASFWSFNWADPNFFYSRRIGRYPQGEVDSDGFVRYPEASTILTAAKISGKIGKGWNVGFLSALTEREFADVDDNGIRSLSEVEPFTYYGVLRVQKEFNEGKQGLGLIATSVVRNLKDPYLKDLLNQNAFAFGLDGWTFLDKDKAWVTTFWAGGTIIKGSEERISDLQRSSLHYYQRPDADHVSFNENRTSLSGYAARFTLNKQKGNFIFNTAVGLISPGFDVSDMGFQFFGDRINYHVAAGYRYMHPGKIFRQWDVILGTNQDFDFGGNKVGDQRLVLIAEGQFLNYWSSNFQITINPRKWDPLWTRGGPIIRNPTRTWMNGMVHSDDRKPIVFMLGGFYGTGEDGFKRYQGFGGLRWKPRSNFSLYLGPEYDHTKHPTFWVENIEDEWMTATYGTRHIMANLNQKTLSAEIRLDWVFNPKLSLQAYIQPFISVGTYTRFKELAMPGTYDFNVYGENHSTISYTGDQYRIDPDGTGEIPSFALDNPDFNFKSLRGTVVLRWEFRLGSTLYLVWTQNRVDETNPGDFNFNRNIRDLFSAEGDNIFMLKFTYRIKM